MWDITIPADRADENGLKKSFRQACNKWVFQLEKGEETGYLHYQCRVSLHKKTTLSHAKDLIGFEGRYTPSSSNSMNKTNKFSYVLKSQTRISGPFADTDPEEEDIYIPEQYRVQLYPWQQELYDIAMGEVKRREYRHVHLLYDVNGGIGKTTMALNLTCRRMAEYIPPMNDTKDIMRMVFDLPPSRCYIVDLTRSMKKDKLHSMYSAIEQIKNGYIYEDRYKFQRKFIDSPAVIVLTNELPSMNYLSLNRWKIHLVEDGKLIDFDINNLDDNRGLDD